MKSTYLILPNCDDTNRGDQALIWETAAFAREAGYDGRFYMLAEREKSEQSRNEDIWQMDAILPHPSVHFKTNRNIQYGKMLKLQWTAASLIDAANAMLLTNIVYRKLFLRFYPEKVKRTIHLFEGAEAAFVKGGGFLHTYGGMINTYQNFYDLYHIILAQSMNKPVYVMPNSFGPFLSPFSAKLVRKVISKCRVVASRESISQSILANEAGVQSILMPDLAFFLDVDSNLTSEQKWKLDSIPFHKGCVALTVRPYRFPGKQNPKQLYWQYKEAICEAVRHLVEKGYYPVLVEHTFSTNQHEQDMCCIQDIQKMLGNSVTYGVYSDHSLNCRQLKYVYSKFKYMIGTRFHSVIFSIAAGVPAIAIGYGGNKGRGIMNDIGISDYVIPIEEVTGDTLISKFDQLVENENNVKVQIREYLDDARKRKRELIECLKEAQRH